MQITLSLYSRASKSDLNSTEAYFATKNDQKLPKMAQKLAQAEKNSTDISAASATFCISALQVANSNHTELSALCQGWLRGQGGPSEALMIAIQVT